MMNSRTASGLIKKQALELGFFSCGITRAEFLSSHEPHLKKWLEADRQGEMAYMAGNLEKRLNPTKLVDGAKSVVVVLQNYFPEKPLPPESDCLISRYAYGTDYHFVIKEKLKKLQDFITQKISPHQSRIFTDSAPVLERAWAVKAGLGWIGKNSMLITPRNGSWFFIGELITDLELDYDQAYSGDYCGDCRRCIEACPTKAIGNDRMIDSPKCISYLTIEKKGPLPEELSNQYRQWIFGCDICQEVCPWNRFAIPHQEESFQMQEQLRHFKCEDWENLTEEDFSRLFNKSPVKRTKYAGIKRNVDFLKNAQTPFTSEPSDNC